MLVGINLLREGLDLPEVSLVAILDADKEGFLRSGGSLIQTMGRAARNVEGMAILYADKMTDSMKCGHRRDQPPPRHPGRRTTPSTASRRRRIKKNIGELLSSVYEADYVAVPADDDGKEDEPLPLDGRAREGDRRVEKEMRAAAKALEFEKAAELRDRIRRLRTTEVGLR